MKMNKESLADLVKDVAGTIFEERAADMRAEIERNKKAAAEQKADMPFQIAGDLETAKSPENLGDNAVKFLMCLHQSGYNTTTAKDVAHNRGDKNMANAFQKSIEATKGLATSPLASGGALIPSEFATEIIEYLRNKSVVMASGARQFNMPNGSMTIPKQSGTATLGYLGEAANYAISQPTFGDIVLTAKKAGGIVPISEEMLNDSSFNMISIIRDDLLGALSTLNDVTMLRSAGGSAKPTGLRYQVDAANVLAISKAGAVATIAEKMYDLARCMQAVLDSNVTGARNGWVMSNREFVHLSTMLNSNNLRVFPEMLSSGTLLGFPVRKTGNVPINLGTGSDSEIYFGDWSQMLIGETGGVVLSSKEGAAYHDGTNVVASFSTDQVPVKVRLRNDMKLRHTSGFAVLTGVTWGGVAPV